MRKTSRERFPYGAPFRHRLSYSFWSQTRFFLPVRRASRKSVVSRHRPQQPPKSPDPIKQGLAGERPFASSRFVPLCVPEGQFVSSGPQGHAGCDAGFGVKMDAPMTCHAITLGLRLMPLGEFSARGGSSGNLRRASRLKFGRS
jgi:hypothetical protein